jgi:hypothetical protein
MLRNIIILVFICLVTNLHAKGLLQNEDFKTESELITAGGSKSQLLNDTKIYVTADGINETLDDAISLGLLGFQSPLTTEGDLLSFISGENTRLAIGSEGQLLTVVSGVPSWQDAPVSLPDQSSNSQKFLMTNGSNAFWIDPNTRTEGIRTNLLECSGFENCGGLTRDGWVVTTDASLNTSSVSTRAVEPSAFNTSNMVLQGAISPTWDIKAVMTKTVDFGSQQMKAYCEIRTLRPDVKFIAGANAVSAGEQNVINDGKWRFYEIFLVGGDTSQYIEINGETTASAEPIYVDNCFIGKVSPTDIREVSGAQFVGRAFQNGATDCIINTTVTVAGTFYQTPVDADCADWQIDGGGIAATNDREEITILNARTDGYYKITKQALFGTTTTGASCYFTLFADNQNLNSVAYTERNATAPNPISYENQIIATYRATSTGSKTIDIRVTSATASAQCSIFNQVAGQRNSNWYVEFIPDSTSNIVTQSTELTAKTANEFVANVSSTGVVSGENFDWINGNCTNPSTGTYVCTFNSSIFSAIPNCSAMAVGAVSVGRSGRIYDQSTSSLSVNFAIDNTSSTSRDFSLKCTRSTDYNKSATIIGKFSELGNPSAETLKLTNLPIYADDAAAGTGGLTAGQVYKTSTGELRIKL